MFFPKFFLLSSCWRLRTFRFRSIFHIYILERATSRLFFQSFSIQLIFFVVRLFFVNSCLDGNIKIILVSELCSLFVIVIEGNVFFCGTSTSIVACLSFAIDIFSWDILSFNIFSDWFWNVLERMIAATWMRTTFIEKVALECFNGKLFLAAINDSSSIIDDKIKQINPLDSLKLVLHKHLSKQDFCFFWNFVYFVWNFHL